MAGGDVFEGGAVTTYLPYCGHVVRVLWVRRAIEVVHFRVGARSARAQNDNACYLRERMSVPAPNASFPIARASQERLPTNASFPIARASQINRSLKSYASPDPNSNSLPMLLGTTLALYPIGAPLPRLYFDEATQTQTQTQAYVRIQGHAHACARAHASAPPTYRHAETEPKAHKH
eukprot:3616760-Pleurochrysis_carterae.AAC.1